MTESENIMLVCFDFPETGAAAMFTSRLKELLLFELFEM